MGVASAFKKLQRKREGFKKKKMKRFEVNNLPEGSKRRMLAKKRKGV